MKIELEHVLPADIERRSFAIISQELGPRTYGGRITSEREPANWLCT